MAGLRCRCRFASRMTPLQRYSLSPYAKWKHFGQWPWQLTWHLLLIALSTYQVVVFNAVQGVSRRAVGIHFAKAFFPDDYAQFNGDDAVHPWKHYFIFTWEDLVGDMSLALHRYYAMPSVGLTPMTTTAATETNTSLTRLPPGLLRGWAVGRYGLAAPKLTMTLFKQSPSELHDRRRIFKPSDTQEHVFSAVHPAADLQGLLTSPELLGHASPSPNAFMTRLRTMTLSFSMDVQSTQDAYVAWTFPGCVRWSVDIDYHFDAKGQVEVLPGYQMLGTCDASHLNGTAPLPATYGSKAQPVSSDIPAGLQAVAGRQSRSRLRAGGRRAAPRSREARSFLREASSGTPLPVRQGVRQPEVQRTPEPEPVPQSSNSRPILRLVLALTVLVGLAHEVVVVSEFCSAVTLLSGLHRRRGASGLAKAHLRGSAGGAAGHPAAGQPQQAAPTSTVAPMQEQLPEARHESVLAALQSIRSSEARSWWQLSCQQQCLLVRGWMLVASVGNLLSLAYILMAAVQFKHDGVLPSLAADRNTASSSSPLDSVLPRLLLGTGCGLLWLALLQYLEYVPKFYAFVLTLKRAVPRILRFLASVLPLFVAYMAFGLVMFGSYAERWASGTMTLITLFAFVNGDAMQETFSHTRILGDSFMTAVSQLYLYTFFGLFNFVVLMVLIAINEEAFFASRPNAVIDVFDGRQLPIMLRSILERLPDDAAGNTAGGTQTPASARADRQKTD